jgi:type IV pilus assembly protein PilO
MALNDFRFSNLSRPVQIGLVAGMGIVLAALFYMYFLKERLEQLKILHSEIQKLEESVQQTTAIKTRLKNYKNELAQLEERLTVLQSILPSQKETPSLLKSVQQMAAASNLKINRFEPQALAPRDFYSEWPIEMIVEGNYHGLGLFFEKISQATRIIDVKDLKIRHISPQTDPSRTLTATFNATTYVFREEQPQKTSKKKTKKNKEKKR